MATVYGTTFQNIRRKTVVPKNGSVNSNTSFDVSYNDLGYVYLIFYDQDSLNESAQVATVKRKSSAGIKRHSNCKEQE